jgi:hypothetical protein
VFDDVAYAPGQSRAVVGSSIAMLLTSDGDVDELLVTRLWASVRAATDLQDVVDALVEIGIRHLPSLGLVHLAGGTANLLLRGDVQAVLHRADAEPETVTADGAVTWRELAVNGATTIELGTDGVPGGPYRPLVGGIVDAARLRLGEPPPPDAEPAGSEAAAGEDDDDADGEVPKSSGAEDQQVAGEEHRPAARERDEPPAGGHTTVMAVRCPDGHANPPMTPSCRVCGQAVAGFEPVEVSRPVLGRLVFSNGTEVELDRPVVVGRAPKRRRGATGEEPQLVTLPSPDQEISRSHLEVRLDGWQVLVVDLDSTNGTVMTLPGTEPLLLRAGEEYRIKPGTVVSVADEVSFVYEVKDEAAP